MKEEKFSFRRDFKRIRWGQTLWLNFLRSASAGIVLAILIVVSGQTSTTPPNPIVAILMFPFLYFLIFLPLGLLFGFLDDIGVVPLGGIFTLASSIFIVPGDPLVYILHQVKPSLVPVEKFGLFNFNLIIFVLDEEKSIPNLVKN